MQEFRRPAATQLEALARLIHRETGFPTVIWLLDADPRVGEARIHAAAGIEPPTGPRVVRRGDGTEVALALESGSTAPALSAVPIGHAALHSVCATIDAFGRNVGVIQQLASGAGPPLPTDVLDLARAIVEGQTRLIEKSALVETSARLSDAPDVESALHVIAQSARDITHADHAAIYLPDHEHGPSTFAARSAESRGTVGALPVELLSRLLQADNSAVRIDDASTDPRAGAIFTDFNIRAMAGVRIALGRESLGFLGVFGSLARQFTEHEVELLHLLADQASVAVGWAHQMLHDTEAIERITGNVTRRHGVSLAVARDLEALHGYDLSAVQLIRSPDDVIETVAATGLTAPLAGLACHYVPEEEALRDIHSDVARTTHIEIISGDDPRFDRDIFTEFHHERLSRIFAPIVLVRGPRGRIRSADDWLARIVWDEPRSSAYASDVKIIGSTTSLSFKLAGEDLYLDVIGTVEVGYETSCGKRITVRQAQEVFEFASRRAEDLHRTSLTFVLEQVVARAFRMIGATSATLHLLPRPGGGYVYEVAAGPNGSRLLREFPPRSGGLGQRSLESNQPVFVPDPDRGDADDALATANPRVYGLGVRAMAAFPLTAGDIRGVLYVHYDHAHRFTRNELTWVQMLARRAMDAVEHASSLNDAWSRARQLFTLHTVTQRLVDTAMEPGGLLQQIAVDARSILGADVVTLYELLEDGRFETPPVLAGKLRQPSLMQTEIRPGDAPDHVVKLGKPLWEPVIGMGRAEERATFVGRERIKAAVGLPLLVGGETVGVMFVNYRRPHEFLAEERNLIETLATTAAIAIRNRRLMNAAEAVAELGNRAFTHVHDAYQCFVKTKVSAEGYLNAYSKRQDAHDTLDKICGHALEGIGHIKQIPAFEHRTKDTLPVRFVIEDARKLVEDRSARGFLEIRPDHLDAQVEAQGEILSYSLSILLNNALDHGATHVRIAVRRRRDIKRWIDIDVTDNVPGGIPTEQLDDILAGKSASTKPHGLGLALRWLRIYVRSLRGSLTAQSDAQGTTFTLSLPEAGRES